MARGKLSALFSSISGSIGSTTIQNSQCGLIIRSKPKRPGTQTSLRQENKNYMSQLKNSWANIGYTAMQQWNEFSIFLNAHQRRNPNRILNGRSLFFSMNYYRLAYGHAILTVPFFNNIPPDECSFTLNITAGNITIVSSRSLVPANEFLIVFCTNAISPGRTHFENKLKLMKCATGAGFNHSFEPEFLSTFGNASSSSSYYYAKVTLADINTGVMRAFSYIGLTSV